MTTRSHLPSGGVLAAVTVAAALFVSGCGSTSGQPARATLSTSETTAATPSPSVDEPEIAPAPTGSETPVAGRPWDDDVSAACAAAVGDGFGQVAQSADGGGVTSFWTSDKKWLACDVAPGGAPTLISSTGGRPGFDADALALSTSIVSEQDPTAVRFVAAGRLPWPVAQIEYSFPDGHTSQARFVRSDDDPEETWWVVSYTATDGPLVDPANNAADLDPVTISIVGAAAEAFRLPWEDVQRRQ